MATKPLMGKSKLPKREAETEKKPLDLVSQKPKTKLKNFRLNESDLARFQAISKAVNGLSERHRNDTDILRALLLMGERTKPEKLLNLIKEIL